MRVLHIINDFNHTKVHENLIRRLDDKGILQIVYIPLKNKIHHGKNEFYFKTADSNFNYSNILKKSHRFFYNSKIRFLVNHILDTIDINTINIIHASTLYSDGGVAYELNKKYGIPYIVTVRNTDLFTFYKYRKDLVFHARKILANASKIIFISDANRLFFEHHTFLNFGKLKKRLLTINNGIDDFWIDHVRKYKYQSKSVYEALFVGRFDRNKNVLMLIDAIREFNICSENSFRINLNLVGGGGDCEAAVLEDEKKFDWISYKGKIMDKEALKSIYEVSDFFIMISKKETFGLVYLEALSQGLPIIFTQGQGIDGYTDLKVGESVPLNKASVISALNLIGQNSYTEINRLNFENMRWKRVVENYINIYKEL